MNEEQIDAILIKTIASLYPNSNHFNPNTIHSKANLSREQAKASLKRLLNRKLVHSFSTDAWDILQGLILESKKEPADHFESMKKNAFSRKWLAIGFYCFVVVAAIAGFIATIKSIME